jgi:hypothetical protein
MKKTILIIAITCVATIAQSAASLHAEDGSWSWGPFSSSTKTTDATTSGTSSTSKSGDWVPNWKMPDVAGGIQRTGKKVTDQTAAAWNSTTRATKKAWKKTTEVLDPFPDNSTTTLNPSPWAAGGSNATKKPKSSSGGMFNWFGSKETEEYKPATPSEFLKGERP